MKSNSRYLILIPAYNEEKTIEAVVLGARKHAEVCVVDDGSQDRTPEILARIPGIHVIRHKENTHIPGALIDGMHYAVDQGYDYVITMDAGLSHDPDEIPLFMDCPASDLTIGIRTRKTDTPLSRRLLSLMANLIYNSSLDFPRSLFKRRFYKDISSGYRRYSRESMKLILSNETHSKSFDILFETMMIIYRNKLTISEVPIVYRFTNSTLNTRVITDCLKTCFRSVMRL